MRHGHWLFLFALAFGCDDGGAPLGTDDSGAPDVGLDGRTDGPLAQPDAEPDVAPDAAIDPDAAQRDAAPPDAGPDGQAPDAAGCGPGLHDGGDGACLPLGECAVGFDDGGGGQCVPAVQCAGGTHLEAPVAFLPGEAAGITAADLDGDGDLDLLVATTELLLVLENDGAGRFVPGAGLGPAVRGRAVAADLDGDGDQDVVWSDGSAGGDVLVWRKNQGAGRFAVAVPIHAAAQIVFDILPLDFDADGDLDLIAEVDFDVVWFQNLGGGRFGPKTEIVPGGSRPRSANIDGTGRPQIIASRAGATDWVRPADNVRTPVSHADAAFFPADLDGEGSDQLVATSTDALRVYGVRPAGGFGLRSVFALDGGDEARSGYRSDADVVDMDGDGDVDLVGPELWIENAGGPWFGRLHAGVEVVATEPRARSAAADLDGDGDPDIALLTSVDGHAKLRLVRNAGLGPDRFWRVEDRCRAWGDCPGGLHDDGLGRCVEQPACAPRFADDGGACAYLAPCPGGIGAAQRIAETEHELTALVLADMDGDGDLDVVVTEIMGTPIGWHANDGQGHFGRRVELAERAQGGVQALEVVDFDGDGALDLLVTGAGVPPYRRFLRNLGGGDFAAGESLFPFGSDWGALAADVDGDGDVDIVSLEPGARVTLHEMQGGLRARQVQLARQPTGQLRFGRLGADNALFYTTAEGLHVRRVGAGVLGEAELVPDTVGFTLTALADVDHDGDADLVGIMGNGRVRVVRQAAGALGPATEVATLPEDAAPRLAVAELDGPGPADIIAEDDGLVVLVHDFAERASAWTAVGNPGRGGAHPAVGDLDGDGDLDVVVGWGDGDVNWFRNEGAAVCPGPSPSGPQ